MFNVLTGLALGIVIFAITIGVGTVVLQKFGGAIAGCPAGATYNDTAVACQGTAQNATFTNQTTPTGTGYTTTASLNTNLGSSGLAGWTAAIIALAVGLLFIGALMGKKQR